MIDKDLNNIIEGICNFTLVVGSLDEDSNTFDCYLELPFVDQSILDRFWMPISLMAVSNRVRIMFKLPQDI